VRVLLISGSLRAASTNTAALRTLAAMAIPGVDAELYEGMRELPLMDPDDDGPDLHPAVADLRARIGAADAVLLCTPEYAGSLPGPFKNLLDWAVGGGEADGKPVAWVHVAQAGRGQGALEHLAVVLRYLNAAVVEDACRTIPIDRSQVGTDGLVSDPAVRDALAAAVRALRR
jgi:NAD(P)H-dependent FMN reductase